MGLLGKISFKFAGVTYGKGLKLKGMPVAVRVTGAEIRIGDNVTIKSAFWSNLAGMYQRSVIVARAYGARVVIGDHVGMSGVTIYARERIEIGDYTQIGVNAKVMDNDFHPLDPMDRRADIKERIRCAPVVIGRDCFIGANAIILKGTVLGDGCVVGAGSVVTGRFEPGCVIAGNPARVIRRLEIGGDTSRSEES